MPTDRETAAQQIRNRLIDENPSYASLSDFAIGDDLIDLVIRDGIDNVYISSSVGYSYWEFSVGAVGGFQDDNLTGTITGDLVLSQRYGLYIKGDMGAQLGAGSIRLDQNDVTAGAKVIDTSIADLTVSYGTFNEVVGVQGDLDLKAFQIKTSTKFNAEGEITDASIAGTKDLIPGDLILGPQAKVAYFTDDNTVQVSANAAYYGQNGETIFGAGGATGFDSYYAIKAFGFIKDEVIEHLGLEPDPFGSSSSHLQARNWFIDTVEAAVKENNVPTSIALATNVYGFIDNPHPDFDPSQATIDDVFAVLRGDYDPNTASTPADGAATLTTDDIIAQFSQGVKGASVGGSITKADFDISITVEHPDGTLEEVIINPTEHNIQIFETEFADAQVNGIVIASSSETITRADGTVVTVTDTEFENGSNNYIVTETVLADGSAIPADGVTKVINIIERDLQGNYVGQGRTTTFVKDGLVFETSEYQTEPGGNTHFRQDVFRPDGNGGYTAAEGDLYIVPSADLLNSLQTIGSTAGGLLASQFAEENVAKQIIYSAALKTIGEHFGSFGAYLATGSDFAAAMDVFTGADVASPGGGLITADMQDTFLRNLSASVSSAVSGLIVGEVGEALGIDGTIGGAVFEVAANTVTTGFVSETFDILFSGLSSGIYTGLATGGINFSTPFPPNTDGITGTVGDYVHLQALNALGSFAGARLAGELIEPESEVAALFGAAGSALGGAIATGNVVLTASLTKAFAAAGSFIPGLGTAIGAFVGTIAGTLLGNVFGGSEGTPAAWANVAYDDVTKEYKITQSWDHAGGDEALAQSLAQSVLDGVNSILEASGGKLRSGQTAPDLHIGWKDGDYQMSVGDHSVQSFSSAHNMVMHAAFKILKGFDLVGGHAVVMRAWHNSDATNLIEFKEDIEVAEAFQNYLANPTAILALMMDQPDSEVAQAWAAILQRAAELELHLPHEKDLDGGWNEFLLSQGYDSESIPNIDGDSVVIIDPVTGEETILHHIIGPGYEIVRIEGTDGNDIIEVIVDGPSISYIDGGAGDDTITGSEQADVIVGGAGDDVIDGLGGNDWLHGGEGNDTIDGGAGEDLVVGGFDDDILNGGADTDHVYGSYGNDIIYGDAGQDFLKGGEGDDTLHGTAGEDDYLYGEAGDDTLIGYGSNVLIGGKGNDTYDLTPSGSDDFVKIYRGDSHDTVIGEFGKTTVIEFHKLFGINELFFTQDGNDLKILVLGEKQSITVKDYFDPSVAPLIRIYTHGKSWTVKDQILQLVSYDMSLSEQPVGDYNVISDSGMVAREQLYNFSNVWEYVAQGTHLITSGTAGDDSLWPVTAHAYGGAGNDDFDTENSNAHLHEYFYGGSGDDVMHGGYGNDHLIGGLGNDHLIAQYDDDIVYGGHGDDHLEGKSGDDRLYGDQGDDIIDAGLGNDIVEGGDGNDTIILDSGNNIAFGEDGNDTVSGGSGDDIVHGGAGDDDITGFHGNDRLYGDDGNDTLSGKDGDDLLAGGEGNDILSGGYGDDVLYGNNGDDLFKYNLAVNANHKDYIYGDAGQDTLAVYLTSSEATDNSVLIDILGLNSFIAQNKDKASYNEISYSFLGAALVVAGVELIDVYVDNILDQDFLTTNTLSGSNVISGGFNNDFINGGTGSDVISGHDGDDEVYGHEGDDILNGGNGDDQLFGGSDNDFLAGNEGNDILEGSDGSDELQGNEGADVLRGGTGNDILAGNTGEDTLYGGAENDQLSGSEGDDVLHGEDGDDQLSGGAGDDILNGGAGDDAFIFDVGIEKHISFDGTTGSYFRLDDTSSMPATAMTIEVSFRTTATNNAGLVSYATDENDNEIVIYNPQSLDIYIDNYAFQTGLSLNDGQWHDLTVTWEHTNGTVQVFDHGQLLYTGSHYTGTVIDPHGVLVLGQEQDSVGGGFESSQSFNGDIRNFAMWDRVLTSTEIADGASTTDALFGYEFDEDTGNTAYDIVASRDGTLFGVQRQPTYSTYNNGIDNIYDVSGNDKIVFGSGIDVNDVTFRRIGVTDDLEFSIHGTQAGVIHNQFTAGTLETLEFEDGTIIPFTNVSIDMIGTENADNLLGIEVGASINESLYGNGGNDTLYGDTGNDSLYGGSGFDTASYQYAAAGIVADLSLNQASVDGDGGSDAFYDIENLKGSAFVDTLIGDDGVNEISGGDGDDIIRGGKLADILTGGTGSDHFVYEVGAQSHISLNGTTSSYVRMDDTSIMPTTAMTINISFQTTSANKAGIMSYAVPGKYNEIILYNPNSLEIYIDNHSFQTGLTFNDGQWHDLTVTWQQSGLVQLYDHGQLLYSGTNYTGTVIEANGVVILGQEQDALGGGFQSHQAFDGEIGNFAMWNTVLSSSEIADGSSINNALFAYEFNEGSGSMAQDLVGNRDATLHTINWVSSTVIEEDLDIITDFEKGQDSLDISDILDGAFDPVSDAIADFIHLSSNGTDTTVSVDLDGDGGEHAPTTIAILQNTTWISADEMLNNGDIIV